MLFGEDFQGFFGNLLVGGRQESGHGFEYGHIRAHALPHRAHFQTDHARADHAELFRHFGQIERAFVIQHVYIIDFHQGQRTRHRAGGHNHVFGFDNGFFAVVVHFDLIEIAVFAFKAAFAEKAGHFVFLKQKFHAAGELGHNRIFALNHFGRIKGQTAHADAVLGKIVLCGVKML